MTKKENNSDNGQNSSDEELVEFEIKHFDPQIKPALQNFDCGNESLNRYAKQQMSQDERKGISVPYILEESGQVVGFYTLSNASIDASDYLKVKTGVGKQQPVPVTLLGRLAVDLRFQRDGYGGILLIDALKQSLKAAAVVGSKAVIVDPIDENAVNFYLKFGFMSIPDTERMLLTLKEAEGLV